MNSRYPGAKYLTMSRIPLLSKYGLICFFCYLVAYAFGRILFPFGDEPDFITRAPRLLNTSDHPFWFPFFIFKEMFSSLTVVSSCQIVAGPMSIWMSIDAKSCGEDFVQVLIRYIITIVIVSPIFFAILFRRFFVIFMSIFGVYFSTTEWNIRLNAMGASLLFPGLLYYLGVFGYEPILLVIFLFTSLFLGNFLLCLVLVSLAAMIDIGDSLVVLCFILFSHIFLYIARKFGLKYCFLVAIVIVVCSYFIGLGLLYYISKIPFLEEKAIAMFNLLDGDYFFNKYPLILRPVITFMSFVFMTPSFIKVIPLYFFVLGVGVRLFFKVVIRIKKTKREVAQGRINNEWLDIYVKSSAYCLSGITTILIFVFQFPNYANSKYYIFILPCFMMMALSQYSKWKVILFSVGCTLCVFFSLILYRL